jgi:hypothetical protein
MSKPAKRVMRESLSARRATLDCSPVIVTLILEDLEVATVEAGELLD